MEVQEQPDPVNYFKDFQGFYILQYYGYDSIPVQGKNPFYKRAENSEDPFLKEGFLTYFAKKDIFENTLDGQSIITNFIIFGNVENKDNLVSSYKYWQKQNSQIEFATKNTYCEELDRLMYDNIGLVYFKLLKYFKDMNGFYFVSDTKKGMTDEQMGGYIQDFFKALDKDKQIEQMRVSSLKEASFAETKIIIYFFNELRKHSTHLKELAAKAKEIAKISEDDQRGIKRGRDSDTVFRNRSPIVNYFAEIFTDQHNRCDKQLIYVITCTAANAYVYAPKVGKILMLNMSHFQTETKGIEKKQVTNSDEFDKTIAKFPDIKKENGFLKLKSLLVNYYFQLGIDSLFTSNESLITQQQFNINEYYKEVYRTLKLIASRIDTIHDFIVGSRANVKAKDVDIKGYILNALDCIPQLNQKYLIHKVEYLLYLRRQHIEIDEQDRKLLDLKINIISDLVYLLTGSFGKIGSRALNQFYLRRPSWGSSVSFEAKAEYFFEVLSCLLLGSSNKYSMLKTKQIDLKQEYIKKHFGVENVKFVVDFVLSPFRFVKDNLELAKIPDTSTGDIIYEKVNYVKSVLNNWDSAPGSYIPDKSDMVFPPEDDTVKQQMKYVCFALQNIKLSTLEASSVGGKCLEDASGLADKDISENESKVISLIEFTFNQVNYKGDDGFKKRDKDSLTEFIKTDVKSLVDCMTGNRTGAMCLNCIPNRVCHINNLQRSAALDIKRSGDGFMRLLTGYKNKKRESNEIYVLLTHDLWNFTQARLLKVPAIYISGTKSKITIPDTAELIDDFDLPEVSNNEEIKEYPFDEAVYVKNIRKLAESKDWPCECCGGRECVEDDELIQCKLCQNFYHYSCVTESGLSLNDVSSYQRKGSTFYCPTCYNIKDKRTAKKIEILKQCRICGGANCNFACPILGCDRCYHKECYEKLSIPFINYHSNFPGTTKDVCPVCHFDGKQHLQSYYTGMSDDQILAELYIQSVDPTVDPTNKPSIASQKKLDAIKNDKHCNFPAYVLTQLQKPAFVDFKSIQGYEQLVKKLNVTLPVDCFAFRENKKILIATNESDEDILTDSISREQKDYESDGEISMVDNTKLTEFLKKHFNLELREDMKVLEYYIADCDIRFLENLATNAKKLLANGIIELLICKYTGGDIPEMQKKYTEYWTNIELGSKTIETFIEETNTAIENLISGLFNNEQIYNAILGLKKFIVDDSMQEGGRPFLNRNFPKTSKESVSKTVMYYIDQINNDNNIETLNEYVCDPSDPSHLIDGKRILSIEDFNQIVFNNYKNTDLLVFLSLLSDNIKSDLIELNLYKEPKHNPSASSCISTSTTTTTTAKQGGSSKRITLLDYHKKYYPTYARLYYDRRN